MGGYLSTAACLTRSERKDVRRLSLGVTSTAPCRQHARLFAYGKPRGPTQAAARTARHTDTPTQRKLSRRFVGLTDSSVVAASKPGRRRRLPTVGGKFPLCRERALPASLSPDIDSAGSEKKERAGGLDEAEHGTPSLSRPLPCPSSLSVLLARSLPSISALLSLSGCSCLRDGRTPTPSSAPTPRGSTATALAARRRSSS